MGSAAIKEKKECGAIKFGNDINSAIWEANLKYDEKLAFSQGLKWNINSKENLIENKSKKKKCFDKNELDSD